MKAGNKTSWVWPGLVVLLTVVAPSAVRAGTGDGACLEFNGVNNYFTLTGAKYNLSGDFTWEAWVKRSATGVQQTLVHKIRQGASSSDYYFYIGTDHCLRLNFQDGNGAVQTASSTPLTVGAGWTHVAVKRVNAYNPDSSTVSLYVNGLEVSTTFSGLSHKGTNDGSLYVGGDNTTQPFFFTGRMDEFRVWHTARTAAEIRQNLYSELSATFPMASPPVGYYRFESNLNDATSSPVNGVGFGTLIYYQSGAFAGPRLALDFDGADDYASIDHDNRFNVGTGAFSVLFWVKGSDRAIDRPVIDKSNDTRGLIITLKQTTGAVAVTIRGSTPTETKVFTRNVLDDAWHHVAVTRDASGNLSCYVDGVLDETAGGFGGSLSHTTAPLPPLLVGVNQYPAGYFKGQLDELRLWNTARTAQEIREAMTRNLTGRESGLLLYLRFDDGEAGSSENYTRWGLTHYDNSRYSTTPLTVNLSGFGLGSGTSNFVASAAFNTWLSAANNGLYTAAANWSRDAVPTSTDNVGIYTYPAPNTAPAVNANAAAATVVLASGATLTLSGNAPTAFNYDVYRHFLDYGTLSVGTAWTVEFKGSAPQVFHTATSPNLNNLTLNQGAASTLTLSGNKTVNGTLRITSGDLYLNGATVYLGSSATLDGNGDDNRVYANIHGPTGSLETTRVFSTVTPYPGNVAKLGAEIVSTDAALGATTIRRTYGPQTGDFGRQSINYSFVISPATNDALNATWRYHYADNQLNGITETDLAFYRYSDAYHLWEGPYGDAPDTTNNHVEVSGVNAFSLWTLASRQAPLLIRLVSFTAAPAAALKGIRLEWATASEIDNAGFHLWRAEAPDGPWFRVNAHLIPGLGTEATGAEYAWVDTEVGSLKAYWYQLEDVDFRGCSTYHGAVAARSPLIVPNPLPDAGEDTPPPPGSLDLHRLQ
ncbi:MAG: LamG domain-containing protein [Acidobacteria bacterium]|nr:LamG domain-containing protein [Acidobacteriota bacterium]